MTMTDRQTKWLSPRSLIFLSVLFLCFATVGLRADSDDPCSSSAILSELHSYYPVPISASPDGALILAAAEPERESDNGLVVIDAKTRNVIKSLKWSEPMIHILWKPGGQAVSFFSQESGTNLRHLIVWDLKDGSTREIPTLATFNQPHVFWSPDGTKLAYSQETKAIVIVSAGETAKPVVYPGKFAIFAWSCDSQHLALVPDDNSHQILLANASSSRVIQTITTKDDGKVVD